MSTVSRRYRPIPHNRSNVPVLDFKNSDTAFDICIWLHNKI